MRTFEFGEFEFLRLDTCESAFSISPIWRKEEKKLSIVKSVVQQKATLELIGVAAESSGPN